MEAFIKSADRKSAQLSDLAQFRQPEGALSRLPCQS
jgi:hypothetical protein